MLQSLSSSGVSIQERNKADTFLFRDPLHDSLYLPPCLYRCCLTCRISPAYSVFISVVQHLQGFYLPCICIEGQVWRPVFITTSNQWQGFSVNMHPHKIVINPFQTTACRVSAQRLTAGQGFLHELGTSPHKDASEPHSQKPRVLFILAGKDQPGHSALAHSL